MFEIGESPIFRAFYLLERPRGALRRPGMASAIHPMYLRRWAAGTPPLRDHAASRTQPVNWAKIFVKAYGDWETPLHESLAPPEPHWRSRLTDQNVSRAMWWD
jgi:hypothetical protein